MNDYEELLKRLKEIRNNHAAQRNNRASELSVLMDLLDALKGEINACWAELKTQNAAIEALLQKGKGRKK